jgi:hypothetical protein
MNTIKMPGFTAEASLNRASRNYSGMAAIPTILGIGALTLALDNDPELGYIDCNDFPNNITCRECGNTGPGSVICCPNDYCIVNNPPEARGRNWGLLGSVGRRIPARI